MFTEAVRSVLDSKLDGYTKPKTDTISGVNVYFEPVQGGESWSDWRQLLEGHLHLFEEVGWLDDLANISIVESIDGGYAIGQYLNGSVNIVNEVDTGEYVTDTVERSKRQVLTHEVLHHAHLYHNGFRQESTDPVHKDKIQRDVSYYAGHSPKEFVAEAGAGIALGYDYPDYIHGIYEKYDGPMGVYDIRGQI